MTIFFPENWTFEDCVQWAKRQGYLVYETVQEKDYRFAFKICETRIEWTGH